MSLCKSRYKCFKIFKPSQQDGWHLTPSWHTPNKFKNTKTFKCFKTNEKHWKSPNKWKNVLFIQKKMFSATMPVIKHVYRSLEKMVQLLRVLVLSEDLLQFPAFTAVSQLTAVTGIMEMWVCKSEKVLATPTKSEWKRENLPLLQSNIQSAISVQIIQTLFQMKTFWSSFFCGGVKVWGILPYPTFEMAFWKNSK